MTRVALIGSHGQLGSDIASAWASSKLAAAGHELVALTHSESDGIDITDAAQVRSVLGGVQPGIVINTAAFIRVDDCEDQTALALEVNTLGAKYLADVCKALGAVLVQISTDYVFDGEASEPYREADAPSPESAYGISKLAGEQFVRYILPEDHIVIRSSGLYGVAGASGKGGNFVETMLRVAREGRPIKVVNDQVTCPTFTRDLAETLLELVARGGRGTYHVTNAGSCTWHDFAAEIFALCGVKAHLSPTTTAEYGLKARRPAYSVLANARLAQLGIEQPRPWREALRDYLRLKGHLS